MAVDGLEDAEAIAACRPWGLLELDLLVDQPARGQVELGLADDRARDEGVDGAVLIVVAVVVGAVVAAALVAGSVVAGLVLDAVVAMVVPDVVTGAVIALVVADVVAVVVRLDRVVVLALDLGVGDRRSR